MSTPLTSWGSHSDGLYVELKEWRFLETYWGHIHLAGRCSTNGKVWTSGPIHRFDVGSMTGVTQNGLHFHLVGGPGPVDAAVYVISICAVFDSRLLETRDITEQYLTLLTSMNAACDFLGRQNENQGA